MKPSGSRSHRETLDIYAPIANRLGMSKIKNELEELAFLHLEPKAHDTLKAWVEETTTRDREDGRGPPPLARDKADGSARFRS